MVVGLYLHQNVRQRRLLDVLTLVIRLKTTALAAFNHRAIIAVGDQSPLRADPMGIADHVKQ